MTDLAPPVGSGFYHDSVPRPSVLKVEPIPLCDDSHVPLPAVLDKDSTDRSKLIHEQLNETSLKALPECMGTRG